MPKVCEKNGHKCGECEHKEACPVAEIGDYVGLNEDKIRDAFKKQSLAIAKSISLLAHRHPELMLDMRASVTVAELIFTLGFYEGGK